MCGLSDILWQTQDQEVGNFFIFGQQHILNLILIWTLHCHTTIPCARGEAGHLGREWPGTLWSGWDAHDRMCWWWFRLGVNVLFCMSLVWRGAQWHWLGPLGMPPRSVLLACPTPLTQHKETDIMTLYESWFRILGRTCRDLPTHMRDGTQPLAYWACFIMIWNNICVNM